MSMIDCRLRDGVLKFRMWSTVVDGYLTSEMTEEEARRWILTDRLDAAYRAAMSPYPHDDLGRLERAKQCGSSSMIGDTCPLDAPWRKEISKSRPRDEDEEPDLDGMFFFLFVGHGRQVDAEQILDTLEGFEEGERDKFMSWAELAAFGEVFSSKSRNIEYYVIRTLPPNSTMPQSG